MDRRWPRLGTIISAAERHCEREGGTCTETHSRGGGSKMTGRKVRKKSDRGWGDRRERKGHVEDKDFSVAPRFRTDCPLRTSASTFTCWRHKNHGCLSDVCVSDCVCVLSVVWTRAWISLSRLGWHRYKTDTTETGDELRKWHRGTKHKKQQKESNSKPVVYVALKPR